MKQKYEVKEKVNNPEEKLMWKIFYTIKESKLILISLLFTFVQICLTIAGTTTWNLAIVCWAHQVSTIVIVKITYPELR